MQHPAATPHPLWYHYPWLLGLMLAPLLMGGVTAESQVIAGLLICASLFLHIQGMSAATSRRSVRILAIGGGVLLLLPLVPLPVEWMAWLHPERVALAREFPVTGYSGWIPLSLSPARTIHRIWELALVAAVYWLARRGSRHPLFPRCLVITVASTLLLLGFSDILYRWVGRNTFLGTGELGWGDAAGTFANRNHFANWIYVGTLFCGGWVIRNLRPLRRARPPSLSRIRTWPEDAFGLIFLLAFALTMAILSGSRGGFLAFLAGSGVAGYLWVWRSRGRYRWKSGGLIVAAGAFLLWAAGGPLFERLGRAGSDLWLHYPKFAVWEQSIGVAARFPWFGTGWGTFVTAFNHYKNRFGETTFWHAENDYLQLLFEGGVVGFLFFTALLVLLIRPALVRAIRRRNTTAEPELLMSGVAAMAAFAIHAGFEFVFQIVSNALLLAAIAGFVEGMVTGNLPGSAWLPVTLRRRLVYFSAAASLFLAVCLQAFATFLWHAGLRQADGAAGVAMIRRSLALWPWEVDRQIALSRLEVNRLTRHGSREIEALTRSLRAEFRRTLRWDPYNWNLRLEWAWLELAFGDDRGQAIREAQRVIDLNPTQPEIPLRFARHFAAADPLLAWRFLEQVPHDDPGWLRKRLEVAWEISGSTADLWSLTPDSVDGLLQLGEFALESELFPMAAQAIRLLEGRLDPVELADMYLRAQRPESAIRILQNEPRTPVVNLLLARAHYTRHHYETAIECARMAWNTRFSTDLSVKERTYLPPVIMLRRQWQSHPRSPVHAERLAEAIHRQLPAQRDLGLLRELAAAFPKHPRILWIAFQAHYEAEDLTFAAATALKLAALSLTRNSHRSKRIGEPMIRHGENSGLGKPAPIKDFSHSP